MQIVKSKLSQITRILVAVASLVFIVFKIKEQTGAGGGVDFSAVAVGPLLAAVALMPLNWFVESLKWRALTSYLQPLSVLESLKSVLAGLAVSMLTPNRVGDFAGRITFLKPENRTAGAMSAFVGGYVQLLAIAAIGVVAFGMQPVLPEFLLWTAKCRFWSVVVTVGAVVFLSVFYFFCGRLALRFSFGRWPWLEKFVRAAGQHSAGQLAAAFGLSVVRCAVFMFQFGLVLAAVGIRVPFAEAFCAIALMYCFVSVIPSFALVEWGVRGSMALLFIMPVGGQPLPIVTATVAVWLMNVAFPAAVGALLFFLPAHRR